MIDVLSFFIIRVVLQQEVLQCIFFYKVVVDDVYQLVVVMNGVQQFFVVGVMVVYFGLFVLNFEGFFILCFEVDFFDDSWGDNFFVGEDVLCDCICVFWFLILSYVIVGI